MRHGVFGRHLGRDINTRKALFRNLIASLILHGYIKTTEAKAKAIKGLVDKLVSRSKQKTLHARRLIAAFITDKDAVNKLMDEIAPQFANRTSGFTRILRLGKRVGDQAQVVKMEFVEPIEPGFHAPKKEKLVKEEAVKEVKPKEVKKVVKEKK